MAWNLVNYHTTVLGFGVRGPDVPYYNIPLHSSDLPIQPDGKYPYNIYYFGINENVTPETSDNPGMSLEVPNLHQWRQIYDEMMRGFNWTAHFFNQWSSPDVEGDPGYAGVQWGFTKVDGVVEGKFKCSYKPDEPVWRNYGDVFTSFSGTPFENNQILYSTTAYDFVNYDDRSMDHTLGLGYALNPIPGVGAFNPVGWPFNDAGLVNNWPTAMINTIDNRQYKVVFTTTHGVVGIDDSGVIPEVLNGLVSIDITFTEYQHLTGNRSDYAQTIAKTIEDEEEETGVMARFQPRVSTSTVGAYIMRKEDVLTLVRDFWETDLIESIRTAFIGDGSNTVLGLYWFYGIRDELTIGDGEAHPVLGNVVYDTVNLSVSITDFVRMDMGKVKVEPYYGNSMDYANTTYHCFIPFVGNVQLDPNDVLGKEISLIYIINLTDGSATATLTDNGVETGSGVIFTTTCSWGYDIPLRANSQMNALARIYHELAPVSGSLGGAEGGTFSAGSLSPNSNVMSDFQPKIIIHRQEDISGSDFTQVAGAPGAEPVTVGSTTGFLQASHILNAGSLPMRQTSQIEALLREGVYVN